MYIITPLIFFVFGATVGSFLNVVALRYNTGRSLSGRSSCSSCSRALSWSELVPVLSFLLQKGRCRACGSSLSVQYPLVEFLTGFLFAALYLKGLTGFSFLFLALITSLYVVIAVYDIRHSIVPNGLSYSAALLTFAALFFNPSFTAIEIPTLVDLASGPAVAFPLFLLWATSSGKWMGLGDAKLALSIGWLLGLSGGGAALLIAFWVGALVGVLMLLSLKFQIRRRVSVAGKSRLLLSGSSPTIKSEIPFAPFLLFGFAVVFFFDINIIQLIFWNL